MGNFIQSMALIGSSLLFCMSAVAEPVAVEQGVAENISPGVVSVAGQEHLAGTLAAIDIVQAALDHWRGQSSWFAMTMTINRPQWQRRMSMQGWTRGDKLSLIRVTAPAKDKGNATLLNDNAMWTFSPKINRVIKVPSSMMGQSWMGSDFSNKDIARSDDILSQYDHRLLEVKEEKGHRVYVIESIPHEEAAVVWGREVLSIRDDFVLLQEQFFDQDNQLVKTLQTLEIAEIDGRTVASRQRMQKVEASGEWTEVLVEDARFDIDVKNAMFTLSNLRNPRQ